ncbi:hypothetical protein [Demequina litorisediminis]|uniref:hypothetical protein n=1 Tax=Demequina litorisediminis TaxID=1849022 RepID=UPI0024E0C93B|nr:hypothetical protein [Demequina litorisediminis]
MGATDTSGAGVSEGDGEAVTDGSGAASLVSDEAGPPSDADAEREGAHHDACDH